MQHLESKTLSEAPSITWSFREKQLHLLPLSIDMDRDQFKQSSK